MKYIASLIWDENDNLEFPISVQFNAMSDSDASRVLDKILFDKGFLLNENDFYVSNASSCGTEWQFESADGERGLPLQYIITKQ